VNESGFALTRNRPILAGRLAGWANRAGCSFLKKELKSFCPLAYEAGLARTSSDKSLLLLFFRKEDLSSMSRGFRDLVLIQRCLLAQAIIAA
jgi:hypothetical protein